MTYANNANHVTAHTPTPWHYEAANSITSIIASDPTEQGPYGTYIAEIDGQDVGRFMSREQHQANARRICAAVNACQGIPTEALESGPVKELLKLMGDILADTHSNKERN
jgi:hypothetical protein